MFSEIIKSISFSFSNSRFEWVRVRLLSKAWLLFQGRRQSFAWYKAQSRKESSTPFVLCGIIDKTISILCSYYICMTLYFTCIPHWAILGGEPRNTCNNNNHVLRNHLAQSYTLYLLSFMTDEC